MRKILAMMLLLCMCFSLAACDIQPIGDGTEETAPPTEAPVPPSDNQAICEYLKAKYGKDFTYVDDIDEEVYYYKTEDFPDIVTVYTLNALWLQNYDMQYFSESYADNGYIYTGYNEMYKYFWQYVEVLNQASMLMDMSANVLPSAVSTEHSFEKNMLNFGDFFKPTLYILTEQEVPSFTVREMKDAFERNNVHVTVIFITTPRSEWSSMTLKKLDNQHEYPRSQFFTTFDAVQQ